MCLDALIFDVDGTLADAEEVHRQAFNAAFLIHKLRWERSPSLYAKRDRPGAGGAWLVG